MDLDLQFHFGSVARTWAESVASELEGKPAEEIRAAVDKETLPRMVWQVCKACAERGIRNPDKQEAYAKHAVEQFDRRLDQLLARRITTH